MIRGMGHRGLRAPHSEASNASRTLPGAPLSHLGSAPLMSPHKRRSKHASHAPPIASQSRGKSRPAPNSGRQDPLPLTRWTAAPNRPKDSLTFSSSPTQRSVLASALAAGVVQARGTERTPTAISGRAWASPQPLNNVRGLESPCCRRGNESKAVSARGLLRKHAVKQILTPPCPRPRDGYFRTRSLS